MSTSALGTSTFIYIIAGLTLGFGLFILIFGLFGRRIDDHPWCRKCRFDLFGRDEDAEKTCPECGSDLNKAKAIRIGQRRKRRGVVAVGSLVMFFAISGLGFKAYTDAVNVDWQHHKPVSWLIREANKLPGTTSNNAINELQRRYDNSDLTAKQIDVILQHALVHQVDAQRARQPTSIEFIQQAIADGHATPQQKTQYIQNILTEANTLPSKISDEAIDELHRFYHNNDLTSKQIGDILQHALVHQADTQRTWQPGWGNFIQQAIADGHATPQQQTQYFQNILTDPYTLEIRPKIIHGTKGFAVRRKRNPHRTGDSHSNSYWMREWNGGVRIADVEHRTSGSSGSSIAAGSGGSSTTGINFKPEQWERIKEGKNEVQLEIDVALFQNSSQANNDSPALAHKRITLNTTVDFLPPGASTVTLNRDPSLQP